MQPGRPRRDSRCVRRSDLRRHELLERVNRGPERQPPRPEHLEDELLLALVEIRPRKRDARLLDFHACVFAAGAYSSHCAHRSVRPCTVSRYASWISSVTGPGGPISWSSTSRIGVTSAAVPHMNPSSARWRPVAMSGCPRTRSATRCAIWMNAYRVVPA